MRERLIASQNSHSHPIRAEQPPWHEIQTSSKSNPVNFRFYPSDDLDDETFFSATGLFHRRIAELQPGKVVPVDIENPRAPGPTRKPSQSLGAKYLRDVEDIANEIKKNPQPILKMTVVGLFDGVSFKGTPEGTPDNCKNHVELHEVSGQGQLALSHARACSFVLYLSKELDIGFTELYDITEFAVFPLKEALTGKNVPDYRGIYVSIIFANSN